MNENRVPAGVPTGGRFAAGSKAESTDALDQVDAGTHQTRADQLAQVLGDIERERDVLAQRADLTRARMAEEVASVISPRAAAIEIAQVGPVSGQVSGLLDADGNRIQLTTEQQQQLAGTLAGFEGRVPEFLTSRAAGAMRVSIPAVQGVRLSPATWPRPRPAR